MPTTALLVEIVIVGYGFFVTLIPIICLFFGIEINAILDFYAKVPIQYQLGLAYSAGIVWNRICDQVFSRVDDKMIEARFSSKKAFQKARIEVIMEGESVRDYIGNFRSLIRVNRALCVMLAVYLICTPFLFTYRTNLLPIQLLSLSAIVFSEIVLLVICVYGWHRLNNAYVSQIVDAHTIVEDQKKIKKEKK